ncbi:hypothetical protein CERSUDRAFT_98202 [Gelatoporia subvermispora B]|uniref:Uncharacterized protein n=1 Tax=Ceriporiopsis subvermispora (strain B) TaxID=914234 RepID=M2PD16_CERS8|nr:hypothetical protein CERSUDRAFT_98202 [Gelatoporia subvermispora B]
MVPVGTNAFSHLAALWYVEEFVPNIGWECVGGASISQSLDFRFVAMLLYIAPLLTISTRVCTVASDLIVLVVTWSKTFTLKRESARHGIKTPLSTLLLRDGTLCFTIFTLDLPMSALLCFNVFNIAGWATNVFTDVALFFVPLSSIIITHFLLNLRQVVYEPENAVGTHLSFVRAPQDPDAADWAGNGSQPTLRFASFVGNMGALLTHATNSEGSSNLELDWEYRGPCMDEEKAAAVDTDAEECDHIRSDLPLPSSAVYIGIDDPST